mgnify:CR=1 FL=1
MILNDLQSNAVYKAMLALNQANMLIDAWSGITRVRQLSSGVVRVEGYAEKLDRYETQEDFAKAYGLI